MRAIYSDIMKTLHDEAFYEGVHDPEYAIKQIKRMLEELRA